jgi:hypothetical protein
VSKRVSTRARAGTPSAGNIVAGASATVLKSGGSITVGHTNAAMGLAGPHVQQQKTTNPANAVSWTITPVTTGGGVGAPMILITAIVGQSLASQISSITDTGGNTWAAVGSLKQTSGGNTDWEVWQTTNSPVVALSAGTITITPSHSASAVLMLYELSGALASTGPIDTRANTSSSLLVVAPGTTFTTSVDSIPRSAPSLMIGYVSPTGSAPVTTMSNVKFDQGPPSQAFPSLTGVSGPAGPAGDQSFLQSATLTATTLANEHYTGTWGGSQAAWVVGILLIKPAI